MAWSGAASRSFLFAVSLARLRQKEHSRDHRGAVRGRACSVHRPLPLRRRRRIEERRQAWASRSSAQRHIRDGKGAGSTGEGRPGMPAAPAARARRTLCACAMHCRAMDGQNVLRSIRNMSGESTAAWRRFLDELDTRGLTRPAFVIAAPEARVPRDGAPGLEAAPVAPRGEDLPIQRCTAHRHRNLPGNAPGHMHAHGPRRLRARPSTCPERAATGISTFRARLASARSAPDSAENAGHRAPSSSGRCGRRANGWRDLSQWMVGEDRRQIFKRSASKVIRSEARLRPSRSSSRMRGSYGIRPRSPALIHHSFTRPSWRDRTSGGAGPFSSSSGKPKRKFPSCQKAGCSRATTHEPASFS